MRLTRFTDFALRVLIYLGLRPGEWVTIRCISDAYGISRNHLMKVVSQLTRAGYLVAQRGPGGGIQLARPPGEINLGDVIRDTEEDLVMVECFSEDGQCVITPACRLKKVIGQALDAYLDTVQHFTLADLIEPTDALAEILHIPPEAA